MNILFCGDGNIADGVCMSVLSLMEQVKEPLHIYLLTARVEKGEKVWPALPEKFAQFLEKTMRKERQESTVTYLDISHLFAQDLPAANMDTRFTPCCMLRLYADRVSSLPDRILYLDNDVICRKDPSDFYHMDLDNGEFAGVLDYYGGWFFRRRIWKRDYINSGVLLLDMQKIRQTGLFARCRQRCREREMFMPDQSAINKLAAKKILVPRRFNEQRKCHRDTVFQHFTTSFRFFPWFHKVSVKPWDADGMHKTLKLTQYDALLARYLELKKLYDKENAYV